MQASNGDVTEKDPKQKTWSYKKNFWKKNWKNERKILNFQWNIKQNQQKMKLFGGFFSIQYKK